MTIQEYLERRYTNNELDKNSKSKLYRSIGCYDGIILGMEFAEWLRLYPNIIAGRTGWVDKKYIKFYTTEQLFELFLTEKFK
jgi:hypothetical protein